jgi:hypothetical protein
MGLTVIGPHKIAAAAAPLVISVLWVAVAYAQSPVVTASVDRHELTTDETVTLSVVIQSATGAPTPSLPSLEGLMISGRSTQSQLTIVNGRATGSVTYSYVLQPLLPGKLTIEPIRVTLDGRSHLTEPIQLEVEQGTGVAAGQSSQGGTSPPSSLSSDQELLVDAEIDHSDAYQGQQVTYLIRFYRKLDRFGQRVRQASYDEPAFNGFWSNKDSVQTRYETQIEGQRYLVSEVRTLLFPTVTGPLTVGPATLTVPGGFFERGTVLRSEPVTVNVLPLPGGAPDGFNGAVGRFDISASSNADESRVNEPITVTVTLSGEGNIDTLPDPVWPDMPGWRSFDSSSTVSSGVTRGRLAGSKIYERLLVPEKTGDFTVPPIQYVYFDPEEAVYTTVSTEPIPVAVAPGSQPVSDQAPVTGSSETSELSANDIRHIKPVPGRLETADVPLTSQAGYWGVGAAFLALLAGGTAWRVYGRRLKARAGLTRRNRASITAMKALETARGQGVDPYSVSGHVLLEYMSVKLGEPLNGLTHTELAEFLAARGIDPALAGRVVACLTAGEGRFAPERRSVEPAGLLDDTRSLITDLERGLAT